MAQTPSTQARIAYVIIGHKNPDQFIRLVNRLNAPGAYFVIHYDKKASIEHFTRIHETLKPYSNVGFIKRGSCYLGDWELTNIMLRSFAYLIERDIPFDYVTTLSGQDYPIKPNPVIQTTFQQHGDHQLMEYFPLPHEGWGERGGLGRFEKYHFHLWGRHVFYPPNRLSRIGLLKSIMPARRSIPCGYTPYGGSCWFALTHEATRYVYDFLRTPEGKTLTQFFRRTYIPEEMIFQTLFLNSPVRDRVHNDNYRFIDWSRRGPHPEVLTMAHYDDLISSDHLFARKFDDAVDSEVLDKLDDFLN